MLMYQWIALLALCLAACNHDVQPDPAPEAGDTDRDASSEKNDLAVEDSSAGTKDLQMVTFWDFSSPRGCTTTLPATASKNLSGDCSKTASWVCNSQCGGFYRWTCFKQEQFQREIRCNSRGQCECKIGPNGTPTRCTGVPAQSARSGCARCTEVYIWGCCNPK